MLAFTLHIKQWLEWPFRLPGWLADKRIRKRKRNKKTAAVKPSIKSIIIDTFFILDFLFFFIFDSLANFYVKDERYKMGFVEFFFQIVDTAAAVVSLWFILYSRRRRRSAAINSIYVVYLGI